MESPVKMKILTFDVEDWFHLIDYSRRLHLSNWHAFPSRLESGIDEILQLLNDSEEKATFFCLGWICKRYPSLIRRIVAEGHELGTHSHMHELVYKQSRKQFCSDLRFSIDTLQQEAGKKIYSYRAPGFSIGLESLWAVEALIENGITRDSSIYLGSNSYAGIKSFNYSRPFYINAGGALIKEFPISTTHILFKKMCFSGGGYFRMLPYSVIDKCTRTSDYTMAYFHCRDFDKDQPILFNWNLWKMWKAYHGISDCFTKLNTYLRQNDFDNVEESDDRINWNSAERLILK
jgi:polysaccharide deacetylase family protein (PEP-CTERM system associated)